MHTLTKSREYAAVRQEAPSAGTAAGVHTERMSKSQRWVPTFPGETRWWERAISAAALGVCACFFVRPDAPRSFVPFIAVLLILGMLISTWIRDAKYFSRSPKPSVRSSVVAVLAVLSVIGVSQVLSSFSDGSLAWGILAGIVTAIVVFVAQAFGENALRREAEQGALAPAAAPRTMRH